MGISEKVPIRFLVSTKHDPENSLTFLSEEVNKDGIFKYDQSNFQVLKSIAISNTIITFDISKKAKFSENLIPIGHCCLKLRHLLEGFNVDRYKTS